MLQLRLCQIFPRVIQCPLCFSPHLARHHAPFLLLCPSFILLPFLSLYLSQISESLYIRNGNDIVQLALVSSTLGNQQKSWLWIFVEEAENNPTGSSLFCCSTLSWLQQLKLFQGPESQGSLGGVWLEHCATPSRQDGSTASKSYTCQSETSLQLHAMARGQVSVYCWKGCIPCMWKFGI